MALGLLVSVALASYLTSSGSGITCTLNEVSTKHGFRKRGSAFLTYLSDSSDVREVHRIMLDLGRVRRRLKASRSGPSARLTNGLLRNMFETFCIDAWLFAGRLFKQV